MTFSYMARTSNGSVKRGTIVAESRTDALARIRAQGDVPLSVQESQTYLGTELTVAQWIDKIGNRKAIVGIVTAVVVLFGAWFFLLRSASDTQRSDIPVVQSPISRLASAEPATRALTDTDESSSSITMSTDEPVGQSVEAAIQPAPVVSRRTPVLRNTGQTNNANRIIVGNTNRVEHGYSSNTELVINMIVNTRRGMPPPPILASPPRHDIQTILDTDIILYETDSDDVYHMKSNVAYVKQILKEYIADGGTVEEFLQTYRNGLQQDYEERQIATRRMSELLKTEGLEAAELYIQEQNAKFEKSGIVPLIIPTPLRQQLEAQKP